MKWNVLELQERRNKLLELLYLEKDEDKRRSITNDLNGLSNIIAYVTNDKCYEVNNDSDWVVNKKRFNEILLLVKENLANGEKDYLKLYMYRLPRCSNKHRNVKISNDEYYDLMYNFFKEFNPDVLDIFIKYVNESRIELNPKKYFDYRLCGLYTHILSEQSGFVNSRYNGRIESTDTLVHEIAHAYQFNGVSNPAQLERMKFSMFSEAYSLFIELAYMDYLKKTKYRNNAFEMEYNQIDSYICDIECDLSKLISLNESTIKNGRFYFDDGNCVEPQSVKLFYSNLLSIYLINKYRNNVSEANMELDRFNGFYIKGEEEKLFHAHTPEEYVKSMKEVIHNYGR